MSLTVAYLLRFDFDLNAIDSHDSYMRIIMLAVPIKLFIFWKFDLATGWFRYASLADALRIVQATLLSSAILGITLYVLYQFSGVPRSVLILDSMATFLIFSGLCFGTRAVRESYLIGLNNLNDKSTLVIGAGEAGQSIVREIRKNRSLGLSVIGFVDDDPLKKSSRFQGVPVLGTVDDLADIIGQKNVSQIIIALPRAGSREMRRIIDTCASLPVTPEINTLPAMSDLIDGRVTVQQIRELDVNDLLGRRSVQLDFTGLENLISGKTVLITGAAGSIGSELTRQISKFHPRKLILLDIAESPLFNLELELARAATCEVLPIVGSVFDESSVDSMFKTHSPELVFHAAAYKHVPLMEKQPAAAIRTNVFGTKIMADAAARFSVGTFVLISTDKAVNPTNVMGATKRCAEMYVQGLSEGHNTRFVTVRFGNVLDSAGSVVPIFKAQIRQGGPVTVTHPEVTRFFMTIPEAAQLVLQAGCLGKGGEILLLDMGEPVKITYLAEEMIRLSGFVPYEDIDIVFTGLRPGEKLYEELLLAGEGVLPTSHEAIRTAGAHEQRVANFMNKFEELISMPSDVEISHYVSKLVQLVPEYSPEVHSQALGEAQKAQYS